MSPAGTFPPQSLFSIFPLCLLRISSVLFLYSQIAVRKEHETAQMFLRSGPSGLQLLRTSMTCLFHRLMQAHGGLGLVMNTACLLEHHRDRQQYHGHNPCGLNRKTSLKRFSLTGTSPRFLPGAKWKKRNSQPPPVCSLYNPFKHQNHG